MGMGVKIFMNFPILYLSLSLSLYPRNFYDSTEKILNEKKRKPRIKYVTVLRSVSSFSGRQLKILAACILSGKCSKGFVAFLGVSKIKPT